MKYSLKITDPSSDKGYRELFGSKEDVDAVNKWIDNLIESIAIQRAKERINSIPNNVPTYSIKRAMNSLFDIIRL